MNAGAKKMSSGQTATKAGWTRLESPSGPLAVATDPKGAAIACINFFPTSGTPPADCSGLPEVSADQLPAHPILAKAVGQLEEYFAGKRTTFDLPLHLPGTEFQKSVWAALQQIPYGETTTYSDIANRINRPAARRAVGAANGRNPICICVPCHRVIGSNGQLVGYSGGLPHKKWLLDMETKNAQVLRAVKNKRRAREQAETTETKEEEITGDKDKDEEKNDEKETKEEPKKRAKKDTTVETSA